MFAGQDKGRSFLLQAKILGATIEYFPVALAVNDRNSRIARNYFLHPGGIDYGLLYID
jgi:hypothetical protein